MNVVDRETVMACICALEGQHSTLEYLVGMSSSMLCALSSKNRPVISQSKLRKSHSWMASLTAGNALSKLCFVICIPGPRLAHYTHQNTFSYVNFRACRFTSAARVPCVDESRSLELESVTSEVRVLSKGENTVQSLANTMDSKHVWLCSKIINWPRCV